MSKKSFTILILVVIALIAVAWWWFFFRGIGGQGGLGGGNNQGNLFPFGQGPATTTETTPSTGKTGTTTIDLGDNGSVTPRLPRLRHVSFVPTAGAGAFDVGSTTMIRYIERATGHIYETPSESSTVTRISNVTIPKIHEAFWSSTGQNVVIRYLKDTTTTIRTFSARISTTTAPEKALEGSFLPDDIQNIALYGNRLFYIISGGDGAQGIRANLDGSGKVIVFNSTFNDWMSKWTGGGITLFSRPSAYVVGAVYYLEPEKGTYIKMAGNVKGLEGLLNADGNYLLYSGTLGSRPATAVYDVKNNTRTELGVSTLASKCVWSALKKTIIYCAVPRTPPSSQYPDTWYKGQISLTDSFWKIDVATGQTENLFSPELEAGVSIDAMSLFLDQNEEVLLFIDKNDLTAWRYALVY